MLPPAACLFDLDGLLLDTEPLHAQAWRQAAARFGTHLDERQLLRLRGRRRLDCAEQVRRWIGGDGTVPPTSEELLAVRQPIAEALLPRAPAMPGARELVRRCGELGIPMAIATSSSADAVALKSRAHPWLDQIRERVYGDDPELRRGKPAPDPFVLAARRLGVACAECWAFEDSPAGARAAFDAGCRVHVFVAPGVPVAEFPPGVLRLTSLAEVRLERAESSVAAELSRDD